MEDALRLKSGIAFGNPTAHLNKYCAAEYEYYDSLPTLDPNRVLPLDVLATVAVNSFVNSAAKVRVVHRGMAQACDHLLRGIRSDEDLRTFDPLAPLLDLLTAAMQTKGILLPVATKVLHRKRPALLPMIDFVVARHYLIPLGRQSLLYRASGGNRQASREVAEIALRSFGETC